MLKILQVRLQQYIKWEQPDIEAGFRKCRGTIVQIANIHWIIEKAREFQKNIYFCFMGSRRVGHDWATDTFTFFCFIDYVKAFDCVNHNKLWKIFGEIRIPDHLTCLLRNLYAGQGATVRIGHGPIDWFQIGKGVRQSCILSSWLFSFYAEYIILNAGLDDSQAGIKIVRRNINNFRYAHDITVMAESKEETKGPLDEGERGVWKSWFKTQHSKN